MPKVTTIPHGTTLNARYNAAAGEWYALLLVTDEATGLLHEFPATASGLHGAVEKCEARYRERLKEHPLGVIDDMDMAVRRYAAQRQKITENSGSKNLTADVDAPAAGG